MGPQRASCGRALLCLLVLSSFTAAGALDHGKRQETTSASTSPTPEPASDGRTTAPAPILTHNLEDITASSSSSASSSQTSTSSSPPNPTDHVGNTLFNGMCLERAPVKEWQTNNRQIRLHSPRDSSRSRPESLPAGPLPAPS
jgi:hypothetical protein